MDSNQPAEETRQGNPPLRDEHSGKDPAKDKQNPVGSNEDAFEQPAEDQDPDAVDIDQFNTD
ncbi:UNVERIFIED_CONTAM: hypothetical protein Q9R71_13305 [Actinomycetes bacterium ARC8]|nr:hypothetical protein [Actinomycetes bacterium ARC8]